MEALMEAFLLEFRGMKESIQQLNSENQILKDTVAQNSREMAQMKHQRESAQGKQSCCSSQNSISALEKKVKKMCEKLDSITVFNKKFSKEIGKVQNLQRVLNIVHVSLQSRKEMESEVRGLKSAVDDLRQRVEHSRQLDPHQNHTASPTTTCAAAPSSLQQLQQPPPGPPKGQQHPSKKAMTMKQAKQVADAIQKTRFGVYLESATVVSGVPVCIGDYTRITIQSDFMDAESGVYTVPAGGGYEFEVCLSPYYSGYIFLCRDRGEVRSKLTFDINHLMPRPNAVVVWNCQTNDKIWVETEGGQEGYTTLDKMTFSGRRLP